MRRSSVTSYKGSAYDEELDEMLSDGAEIIRDNQEKYYRSTIPAIVVSRIKKVADKAVQGRNVKLWYYYLTLIVENKAPYYEKLDDYFINKKPMEDIRYDIVSIDRTQEGETPYTDIYRPELFSVDEAGLELWKRLRSFITDNFDRGYFEGLDDKVEQLVEEIRNYQQKSYGPLIPSIAATYISRPKEGNTKGYSMKIAFDDPNIIVKTEAPFAEEAKDFFK